VNRILLHKTKQYERALNLKPSDFEYRGRLFRRDGRQVKHIQTRYIFIWGFPWRVAKAVIFERLDNQGYQYNRNWATDVIKLAAYRAIGWQQ